MFNIRSVDLNLLPVFVAVYEEGNLSRAGDRLAMTQSAVSHALSRLRAVCRDDLFVRHPRGVQPTAVANDIYPRVRVALGSIEDAVTGARGFDPKTSDRRFNVAIAHPLGPMIALRMRECLARLAPNLHVEYSTRSRPIDLDRWLRDGRIDVAIDWLQPEGSGLSSERLFDDQVVAVARAGHPALRRRSAANGLSRYEFVGMRARRNDPDKLPEGLREWNAANLNFVLRVSEIVEIFMVVAQSDLCGAIPRSMAAGARKWLDLRILPASPKAPPVAINMIWHGSRDDELAHKFLRKQLATVTRRLI